MGLKQMMSIFKQDKLSNNRKGKVNFIRVAVELAVGLALLPFIRSIVNASLGGDANDTIIRLVQTLFILLLLVAVAAEVYVGTR